MEVKSITYCNKPAWRTTAVEYGKKCEVTVGLSLKSIKDGHMVHCPHCFELADIKTGGNSIYEEGSLIFQESANGEEYELVDYDGVYELPMAVVNLLEHQGFDVADIKESLRD